MCIRCTYLDPLGTGCYQQWGAGQHAMNKKQSDAATTSTPQLHVKIPQIPPNRDHEAPPQLPVNIPQTPSHRDHKAFIRVFEGCWQVESSTRARARNKYSQDPCHLDSVNMKFRVDIGSVEGARWVALRLV